MSTINHNHVLSLLQTGFTTIMVTFELNLDETNSNAQRAQARNSKVREYVYKAPLSDNLKVDDLVVVDTPHDGLTIVRVTGVDAKPKIDLNMPFPYKWIVQKVDTARYDQLLKSEEEFKEALVEVERAKQRDAVIKGFEDSLPEDSEARRLFQATIEKAKVLPHAG